jgi:hypothetical protein
VPIDHIRPFEAPAEVQVQRFTLVVMLVACVGLLAACIGQSPACEALPEEIELTLSATTLTPSDPAVCRGDEVTLTVSSEVDGVLHVHGYDEDVPATNVAAGEVLDLEFTATRSGQFPIELHTDEDTEGVNVGLFTVHEP